MSYLLHPFDKLTVGQIKNLSDADIQHFGIEVGKKFIEEHPQVLANLGERIIRDQIAALKNISEELGE